MPRRSCRARISIVNVDNRAENVVHCPTAIDELKLAVVHQLANFILHGIRLLRPPTFKERHLNVDELPLAIFE